VAALSAKRRLERVLTHTADHLAWGHPREIRAIIREDGHGVSAVTGRMPRASPRLRQRCDTPLGGRRRGRAPG
jgi:hypothetical protein